MREPGMGFNRVRQEALRRGLGIVAIPARDAGSCDVDFAYLARGNGLAGLVQNANLRVRDRLANRWRRPRGSRKLE